VLREVHQRNGGARRLMQPDASRPIGKPNRPCLTLAAARGSVLGSGLFSAQRRGSERARSIATGALNAPSRAPSAPPLGLFTVKKQTMFSSGKSWFALSTRIVSYFDFRSFVIRKQPSFSDNFFHHKQPSFSDNFFHHKSFVRDSEKRLDALVRPVLMSGGRSICSKAANASLSALLMAWPWAVA
jgi:hypothetical protein